MNIVQMKDVLLTKGTIYVTSLSSYLLQVKAEQPDGIDEVGTWITLLGGAVYIGLNIPKIAQKIGDLFRKK